MKKVLVFAALCCMTALYSCGNKTEAASTDSIPADSAVVEDTVIEVVIDSAVVDTLL